MQGALLRVVHRVRASLIPSRASLIVAKGIHRGILSSALLSPAPLSVATHNPNSTLFSSGYTSANLSSGHIRMASSTAAVASGGPTESMIREKITAALNPIHLQIENESYKLAVPKGSETHFKVLVVSAAFEGKSLIDRHRLVNSAIGTDASGALPPPLHALSISAKTPSQYKPEDPMHKTPPCKGGTGK